MSDLYHERAGAVVKAMTSGPAFLRIQGIDLRGGKILATGFRIDRSQVTQYQKSLTNVIYAFAFGEAVGVVDVSGLIFFRDCTGEDRSLQAINDFYDSNNIYNKNEPVDVSIGLLGFRAYLENLSLVGDQAAYNYASFNMRFRILPSTKR